MRAFSLMTMVEQWPQSLLKFARQRSFIVVTLLLVHAVLLIFSAVRHSATMDEVLYLVGGVYDWEFGRFEVCRGSPPLTGLVAAFPLQWVPLTTDWHSLPNSYAIARDFHEANGPQTHWLVMLGRWVGIVFSVAGGYFCFRWARELYGYSAGLLVLTLWCFSPYVLRHGQLVGADMPATATGVAAFYMFWRWLNCPSLSRAMLAGLFLGLAELAKFVWVLLFALWPLMWIIWRLLHRHEMAWRDWLPQGGHLMLMVILALYSINLGYGFEKPFPALGQFKVGEKVLERLGYGTPDPSSPSTALGSWAAAFPLPVPENYVVGIDEVQAFCHRGGSYLRREWHKEKLWYYYPYAFLVRIPLGVWGLLVVAAGMTLRGIYRSQWKTEVLLVLMLVTILVFVTASGAPQVDRYGLPALPFLLLLTGKAGQAFNSCRRLAILVGMLLSWSTLSALWIYPHSVTYFNELAGGPICGHAHLAYPSMQWRQDFFYLERWLTQHPEAHPIKASWRPLVNSQQIHGVEYEAVPAGPVFNRQYSPADLIPLAPQPGWYAVEANRLHASGGQYAYFFRFQPVAMPEYSVYVYHISLDEANRVRRSMGMPELPEWWIEAMTRRDP